MRDSFVRVNRIYEQLEERRLLTFQVDSIPVYDLKTTVDIQLSQELEGQEFIDLNADGIKDIVGGVKNVAQIYFASRMPGNSLGDPQLLHLEAGTVDEIISGDLDGDGDLDLVATGESFAISLISTFEVGETLSFKETTILSDRATSPKLADIDSDGNLDLIIGGGASVKVLPGVGDGTFESPVFYPMEVRNGEVEVIADNDVDHDGDLDLLAWARPSKPYDTLDQIVVFESTGDGLLEQQHVLPVDGRLQFAVAFDLNEDGNIDLLTSHLTVPNDETLQIRYGRSDGTFETEAAETFVAGFVQGIESRDVNGDGINDLVVSQIGIDEHQAWDGISLLASTGNRNFLHTTGFGAGVDRTIMDEFEDNQVLILGTNRLRAMQTVFPKFTNRPATRVYWEHHHQYTQLIDLNADGYPDVITATLGEFPSRQILAASSHPSEDDSGLVWNPLPPISTPDARRVIYGNFDADPQLEVVVVRSDSVELIEFDSDFSTIRSRLAFACRPARMETSCTTGITTAME